MSHFVSQLQCLNCSFSDMLFGKSGHCLWEIGNRFWNSWKITQFWLVMKQKVYCIQYGASYCAQRTAASLCRQQKPSALSTIYHVAGTSYTCYSMCTKGIELRYTWVLIFETHSTWRIIGRVAAFYWDKHRFFFWNSISWKCKQTDVWSQINYAITPKSVYAEG